MIDAISPTPAITIGRRIGDMPPKLSVPLATISLPNTMVARYCSNIRTEKVGTHTGYVTYVITHVIGDGSGVTRIIFRNSGFYFTYKVGTDVGSFGINTATYTCEKRDRFGTERKPASTSSTRSIPRPLTSVLSPKNVIKQ
jgi:hypothetical protein